MKTFLLACLIALASANPVQRKYGNPDEWGEYYQGDIRLPLPLMNKNGLIDEKYRWTGNQMVYQFASTFSADNQAIVLGGMDDYISSTGGCISFKERGTEANYVYFTNNNNEGCYSYVGMIGGRQTINYPDWCLNQYGSVLHEMLHAFGFYHQQSASDRDDYVIIHYENIQSGAENNFNKYPDTEITDFGVAYDYGSVMHYSKTAFSSNGEITIETIDPSQQNVIGQREGFSQGDLRKLMAMYNC